MYYQMNALQKGEMRKWLRKTSKSYKIKGRKIITNNKVQSKKEITPGNHCKF